MKRGETKQITLKVNGTLDHRDKAIVSFRQGFKNVLEIKPVVRDGEKITFTLSQKQTLLFIRGKAELQVKICKFETEETFISNIIDIYIEDGINEEVMINEPE